MKHREIDALVAEHTAGWTKVGQDDDGMYRGLCPNFPHRISVPTYSQDILKALRIKDIMVQGTREGGPVYSFNIWEVPPISSHFPPSPTVCFSRGLKTAELKDLRLGSLGPPSDTHFHYSDWDIAKAICMAALKAVEYEQMLEVLKCS